MQNIQRSKRTGRRRVVSQHIRSFYRDDDGEIIILTLLLLVVMLVVGGMGVDFMRQESERHALQSVSDRAVLAAANLDSSLEAEDVVVSYFDAAGYEDAIIGTPQIGADVGSTAVQVSSAVDVSTIFLRLIGMDELPAPAASAAVVGASEVEVAMVLDISGSMEEIVDGTGQRKMDLLKVAAADFVEDVIDPTNPDKVSISLIPYTTHVAASDELFEALNTTPDSWVLDDDGDVYQIDSSDAGFASIDPDRVTTNSRSTCIDFEESDYATTTFDTAKTYQQVETFGWADSSSPEFRKPLCPQEWYQKIIPMSQDVTELQAAIAEYEPTSNTSIQIGMRWATALLDPSARTLLASLPSTDPAFAGVRPLDYGGGTEGGTSNIKYVILMTDGESTQPRRLLDEIGNDFYYRRGLNNYPWNYWNSQLNDHPSGEDIGGIDDIGYRQYETDEMDAWLQESCDAAKDQGIIVFTIAMGSNSRGEEQMRLCATSTSYYFEDDGSGISSVFSEIAATISTLRLTQ